ncbi:alcohol dehydrogenase [Thioclava sp. SK-1]|uniref:iron-containing alcohol dehydrogenase n=1 Tax=Thioclava sp. SK-1 TaxID=1889770 RepID=UPI000824D21D|nr:iron-containing alcohol dehydrogenase [Thioclava sp. SK-1]OCX64616.1 alcohol dehydrogenase [Thioclava sp. SK-1]
MFDFLTATKIAFGRGQIAAASAQIAAMGHRVLFVHGQNPERSEEIRAQLQHLGCDVLAHPVAGEPTLADIEAGLRIAGDRQVVVAMGGGAVIDAGKALAAMIPAPRPLMDHLEVVGKGLPLDRDPLPFVAIPTTAGTGAEVTRNAVIGVPEHQRKVSLRDPRMLPRLAVVDPSLTDGCPRHITLASGLDAITQVIEPYLSTKANPFTDALCRDAIPRGLAAIKSLMQADTPDARDEMAWVSLCGGITLANSGLGAVHGLAGPLGGSTGATHGAICGALLPHILRLNQQKGANTARCDQIAAWIAAEFAPQAADMNTACDALADWAWDAGLPGLDTQGISAQAMQQAAAAAAQSSSMKANPVPLTQADLMSAMQAANPA